MATAIYMRVSTEMQEKEGVSLETQKEQLQAYCTFKGLKNVKEYVDVGSARTTNRTNYRRMMKEVEKGYINNVVILKLDRLTRSIIDLNNIVTKLNELNCGLHSATENIDTTTATGRMIINLIGTFAQWESETISERVSTNMMTLAEKGIWMSSVPYGYDLSDERKLTINKKEASILREAFDMILTGSSLTHAEKEIVKKHNLTWKNNFLRRKIKYQSTIGNMYRNGKVIKNTHEGIITESVQKQLLQRLEINRTGRTSNNKYNDLFRRKIKCYRCSYNLTLLANGSKNNPYRYVCNNCYDVDKKSVSVSENTILDGFNNFFKYILVDDMEKATINKNQKEYSLIKRLDEIQSEKDKIQRAWIKNLISDNDLQIYQKELDEEQEKINSELSKVDKSSLTKREYVELVKTIKDSFNYMDREQKREFVQRFIKNIEFERHLVEGYKRKYDYKVTNVTFF